MKPNDDSTSSKLKELVAEVHKIETEIQEVQLSEDSMEVCVYVAGYIVGSLLKKTSCASCKTLLTDHDNEEHTDLFEESFSPIFTIVSVCFKYFCNIGNARSYSCEIKYQCSVCL